MKSDDDVIALLRGALAAHDDERVLWDEDNIKYARLLLTRARGTVSSLGQVILEVGEERAKQLIPAIVEKRKFDNVLKGRGSPCHYCGCKDDLTRFDFALMRVESSRLKVNETIASAVLSAATLPLLGAGLLRLPGSSRSGAAFHLKLIVCEPCCKKHGNMFGAFTLNEKRASQHPMWEELHDHGFTIFLSSDQMPEEFKLPRGYDL